MIIYRHQLHKKSNERVQ